MGIWEWVVLIIVAAFGVLTVVALVAFVAGAMRANATATSAKQRSPQGHARVRKRRSR